jgi:hypothetical protein
MAILSLPFFSKAMIKVTKLGLLCSGATTEIIGKKPREPGASNLLAYHP